MAESAGTDGLGSPAVEQDPSIAQIQARQAGAQAAIQVDLPPTGFVASIDGLTGLLTIVGGSNISVTNDGVSNITITAIGFGDAAKAKSNITAAAPTPGNDESEGYAVYSIWIDNTIPATPTIYMCSSAATATAIWTALN